MVSKSSHISRLSKPMARLVTAAFWLLVPALALYVILFPDQLADRPGLTAAHFPAGPLSAPATAAAIAALVIISAPTLWGLWELKRLFEGYAAGAIFTIGAALRLRACGYAVLLSAAKTGVGSVLLSLALSIDRPQNARALVVSFSSDDLALLLIGGIVLVIARVMEEAARIADENAAFV